MLKRSPPRARLPMLALLVRLIFAVFLVISIGKQVLHMIQILMNREILTLVISLFQSLGSLYACVSLLSCSLEHSSLVNLRVVYCFICFCPSFNPQVTPELGRETHCMASPFGLIAFPRGFCEGFDGTTTSLDPALIRRSWQPILGENVKKLL